MRAVRFDQYESPSFRTILKRLGLWCTVLLTALAAVIVAGTEFEEFYFIGLIAAPLLIVAFLGASYLLYREYKEAAASYQMRRDKAAIALFNAVMSGDQQKFAVFLRPFYTTDKIYTNQMALVPQQSGGTIIMVPQVVGQHKLEDTLVEAFRSTLPLVALGKPGETFGVGRILVDEDSWQKAASDLMQRASLLICLPSSRPGSNWEMNQIMLNHYFSKTVFIMPPNPPSSFRTWKDLKEDWDLLKQQVGIKGITIPEYKTDGILFSIDTTGQCITERFSLNSMQKLLETFIRLSSPVIRGWG
jgi:hypothetical protein